MNEQVSEKSERFRAITINNLDDWADKYPALKEKMPDIRMSAMIFPFKASPYLVEELIDWDMEGDIATDPFYRLIFPTMTMLTPDHRKLLEDAVATEDPFAIKATVEEIREDLNPHPAGQKALNAPKKAELTGVQHKYSETVLFFAAAAQTCHAYCTYCFRWAQFIGDSDLRFAQKDAGSLFDYLAEHPEVSDILFTGGDPMIMKTRNLKAYLEPFKDPAFLPHIKNLRIGTRALTFWPQRFTTDDDADELMTLLREVKEVGGRHMAIMSHLGHVRELQTDKVRAAISRLKQEAGVIIRSQSPVMRGINDDATVWAEKWREEVRLGIVPYYMFMARDTGAQAFFDVPLVRAQRIYADAIRNTSGLCRTARGPSMSCTPGKVEVVGVQTIQGTEAFVLRFLQCRDEAWIGKVFFAKYDPKAVWYDDLEPLDGMELPWEYTGLPRPCIDEACQIEFLMSQENA
uniref:Radical SAM core domain-containing protein n=1 Tax=Coccolithus braarudii TaxID=221442 RepID=A0A6T7KC06_9EUKA